MQLLSLKLTKIISPCFCFLYRRKLNSIVSSCFQAAVGVIRSTPLASSCAPIKIRSLHLTDKCLLKMISSFFLYYRYQSFVTIKMLWKLFSKLFSYWPPFFLIYFLRINCFSFYSPLTILQYSFYFFYLHPRLFRLFQFPEIHLKRTFSTTS